MRAIIIAAIVTASIATAPIAAAADQMITESFTLSPTFGLRLYWTLWGWSRGKVNRKGMRTTLERIRDEVQAPAS